MLATRIRRLACAAAALVTLAACKGDSLTAPLSVFGTFNLQSVNGKALPYVVVDSIPGQPAFRIEVMSPSSLTINADKTFRFVLTLKSAAGGSSSVNTETATGMYTLSGNTVSLTANGETLTGDWDGNNTLTLRGDGDLLVFKR